MWRIRITSTSRNNSSRESFSFGIQKSSSNWKNASSFKMMETNKLVINSKTWNNHSQWRSYYDSINNRVDNNYLMKFFKGAPQDEIVSDFRGKVISLAKTEEGMDRIIDLIHLRKKKILEKRFPEILDIILNEIKGKSVELLSNRNSLEVLKTLVTEFPKKTEFVWKELERNLNGLLSNNGMVKPLSDILFYGFEFLIHKVPEMVQSENGRKILQTLSTSDNSVDIIKNLKGQIANLSINSNTSTLILIILQELPHEYYSLLWKEINETPEILDQVVKSDYGFHIIRHLMNKDIRPISGRIFELIKKDKKSSLLFITTNNYVNRSVMRELRGSIMECYQNPLISDVAHSLLLHMPKDDCKAFWEDILESPSTLKKVLAGGAGKKLVKAMLNKDFQEFFSQDVSPSTINMICEEIDFEDFIEKALQRAEDLGTKGNLEIAWGEVFESHPAFEKLHYWAQNFDKAPIVSEVLEDGEDIESMRILEEQNRILEVAERRLNKQDEVLKELAEIDSQPEENEEGEDSKEKH